ncbi:MAG: hypothetical protein J2P51_16440 [Hyphomicrobiaceae bacterium]|nr:hypothetical protein [Hyphomicrobiaceae bacterium]
MFMLLSRSTLLAGVLTAVLSATVWSADADAVRPKTSGTGSGAPMPMAAAPAADPGVVEEPSAAAGATTTVQMTRAQPTRAHGTLVAGKRYAGNRARVGYFRPIHRYSLMLGIGY